MPRKRPKSKSIDAYRDKRDFRRTPEPPPGKPTLRPGAPVFVVHRHEARRLHYDLRLEIIVMKNGDRFTCEVKGLDAGVGMTPPKVLDTP